MTGAPDLARMVPGFDFLQGLMKNAGAGLPSMGQWIAPTLNPEELEKRIQELKTVHFWLEQNAKLLATTIQALEVQRMTLSTLQTMNLPLADLAESLKIRTPAAPAAPRAAAEAAPAAAPRKPAARKAASAPPLAVDPMQWWGALTQQFTELASQAVKHSAADSAQSLVKASMDTAASALKQAARVPAKAARAAQAAATPRARKPGTPAAPRSPKR
jgi:hypothetical protein